MRIIVLGGEGMVGRRVVTDPARIPAVFPPFDLATIAARTLTGVLGPCPPGPAGLER